MDSNDLLDGVPILGRTREGEGEEALPRVPGVAHYVNDMEASFDGSGILTLTFFHRTNQGARDPIAVSMPLGLTQLIIQAAQQAGPEFLEMSVRKGKAAEATLASARKAGRPTDLDAARARRDEG